MTVRAQLIGYLCVFVRSLYFRDKTMSHDAPTLHLLTYICTEAVCMFPMSVTFGGQMHDQEAAVHQTFLLERSSSFGTDDKDSM